MRMVLVDGSDSLGSRIQIAPKVSGGAIQRSYRSDRREFSKGGRSGGFRRRSRSDRRSKMTEAELDAELEAYMSKPRAQQ
ncbi:hypothetical protein OESDEN_12389 [Oesophagostomum dentatum]|uniref:Chromatin target of PRMT1 protein C-terminal domain-containing protein n=1 Tax=Oesophagostomum dentatum TaxID=61180 RepID=A0A0B1SR85_OESDE|nr:hypothetical protein OESDEN_12389 [Oesophagostomum dentatum]